MKSTLRGVCAAALTPLTSAGEPDAPAVVAHCRRLIALGCDGLNLLGTTGEAMSLSVAQRLRVMDAVAEGEVPLARCMVGTGAAAIADAVELTRRAADLGFAGALVMPPFYFKNLAADGLCAFFDELLERVARPDLALYLYHFPQLSGVPFTPEIVARLYAAYPANVVGLKDSSGVAGYAESIVAAAPIAVFPSSETCLPVARERGFAGCISATLNVSASLAAAVWRSAGDDSTGARAARERVAAVRDAIAAVPLVPALRALVARFAHDERWRRMLPPLAPLHPAEETALLDRLRAIPALDHLAEAFACA